MSSIKMNSQRVHRAVGFFGTAVWTSEPVVRVNRPHVPNQADFVFDGLAAKVAGEFTAHVNMGDVRKHSAAVMKRQGTELAQECGSTKVGPHAALSPNDRTLWFFADVAG